VAKSGFSAARAKAIDAIKYLYIRSGDHRPIAIWVVVVGGRVIVRSWNDKPGGWYRSFLRNPLGAIRLGDSEVRVRAKRVRGARLLDDADDAYAAKYTSSANQKYVKGFRSAKRRSTTLELVPQP
jgi:hypothetical protein